jgi:hypothetical protein
MFTMVEIDPAFVRAYADMLTVVFLYMYANEPIEADA